MKGNSIIILWDNSRVEHVKKGNTDRQTCTQSASAANGGRFREVLHAFFRERSSFFFLSLTTTLILGLFA